MDASTVPGRAGKPCPRVVCVRPRVPAGCGDCHRRGRLQGTRTAGWTKDVGTEGRGKPGRAGPCGRRLWAGTPGSRQPRGSVAGEGRTAPVICPQGEKQKASGCLSASETEFKQKDAMIRDLQDEIAAMAKTLAQAAARNEVELTQKLLTFDRELAAKTEEIKALREQVLNA